MKVKGKEDRNWKEVKCKIIMRNNFKDDMKYSSKSNKENLTN